MKTYFECLPCFVNQALSSLKRAGATPEQTENAMRCVFNELSAIDYTATPPRTGTRIYHLVRNIMDNADPFAADKHHYNAFALSLLPAMRTRVEQAADPFIAALQISIAGNVIDFGKNGSLSESDVRATLDRAFDAPIDTDAARRLREAVTKARQVLFLCDNAGEIVFDGLLIEQLPRYKIIGAVRGAPVINDATMDDARESGLVELVTVIPNGSDAPGTVLSECSDDFRAAFDAADVVIAKGQGNFETLSDVTDKRFFFLLQIKCPVIARDIGFPVGTFVVTDHRIEPDSESKPRYETSFTEVSNG